MTLPEPVSAEVVPAEGRACQWCCGAWPATCGRGRGALASS